MFFVVPTASLVVHFGFFGVFYLVYLMVVPVVIFCLFASRITNLVPSPHKTVELAPVLWHVFLHLSF